MNRPVVIQKVKNKSKQISYALKSYWGQVESYSKEGSRKTKKVNLKYKRNFRAFLENIDRLGKKQITFIYNTKEVGLSYSDIFRLKK